MRRQDPVDPSGVVRDANVVADFAVEPGLQAMIATRLDPRSQAGEFLRAVHIQDEGAAAVPRTGDAFQRQRSGRRIERVPEPAIVCARHHVVGAAQLGAMRGMDLDARQAVARGAFANDLDGLRHFARTPVHGHGIHVGHRSDELDQGDVVAVGEEGVDPGEIAACQRLLGHRVRKPLETRIRDDLRHLSRPAVDGDFVDGHLP